MKTIEQIEERLRVVEQQRKNAEDHAAEIHWQAKVALVRSGEEMALLWVLDKEVELAARLGVAERDLQLWRERGLRFDG